MITADDDMDLFACYMRGTSELDELILWSACDNEEPFISSVRSYTMLHCRFPVIMFIV